ncbi:MAG: hypothetical protein Q9218_006402, partial [Villophora microphyllina]
KPHRASRNPTKTCEAAINISNQRIQSFSINKLVVLDCFVIVYKKAIEIQVPFVAKYTPTRQREPAPRQSATTKQSFGACDGLIIARYTTEDGRIIFAVKPKQSHDAANLEHKEIEVDLENIYQHVTPSELERFEHHDWDLEEERERRRPKVGRPRKRVPGSQPAHEVPDVKPKRPLGRPRKKVPGTVDPIKVKAGRRGRSAFVGVHIQSPMKQTERRTSTPPSSNPSRTSRSSPLRPSSINGQSSTFDIAEDTLMLGSEATMLKIDQLTPANAKRVVGDTCTKIEPSPSKRTTRPSYSMVEAALGESLSSGDEETPPDSESEDELTLAVTNFNRRLAHKAEIAPTLNIEDHHDPAPHLGVDAQDINSPRSNHTDPRTITPQKTPARAKDTRKSMTPHFPSNTKSIRNTSIRSPSKPLGGGQVQPIEPNVMSDRDQIRSLLGNHTKPQVTRLKDHTITLGSPITSSDEDDDPRVPHQLTTRPAPLSAFAPSLQRPATLPHHGILPNGSAPSSNNTANLMPPSSSSPPTEIILGSPITSSSDEAEPNPSSAFTAINRGRPTTNSHPKKRRRSSSSRSGRERWYRMVRR